MDSSNYCEMVTIVVPVYNAERYVARCIDSIIGQSYSNFELILINDGSTDKSEAICERYVDDCRVRIINKVNGGVSSARNEGIRKARGKYITFVDADDWIDKDYVKVLVDNIKDYDLSICQYWQVTKNGESKIVEPGLNNIDSPFMFFCEYTEKNMDYNTIVRSRPHGFVWRCMFRKSVINEHGLTFNSKISYSEDLLFLLQYLAEIPSDGVNYVDQALYYYFYDNESSACHQITKKNLIESRSVFILELIEICKKYYHDSRQYDLRINEIRYDAIYENIFNLISIKDYKEFRNNLVQLNKSDLTLNFSFKKLKFRTVLDTKLQFLMVLLLKINAYSIIYGFFNLYNLLKTIKKGHY